MNIEEQRAADRAGVPTRSVWDQLRESTQRLEREIEALREALSRLGPLDAVPEPGAARAPVTFKRAIDAACQVRPWLGRDDVLRSRASECSHIRGLAWLAQVLSGRTFTQIGEDWAGRDHTTVIYGVRRAVGKLQASGTTNADWERLLEQLDRNDLRNLWRAYLPDDQPAGSQEVDRA